MTKQVFICRHDFKMENGVRTCKYMFTTSENEARIQDSNFRLATLDDLHHWVCQTGSIYNDVETMADSLYGACECEQINVLKSLHLTASNYEWLTVLINNDNDLEEFLGHYWMPKKQGYSIGLYRCKKIDKNQMTVEEFIESYNVDKLNTLIQVFQQPLYPSDIEKIEQRLTNDNKSLRDLCESHMADPYTNLWQFVL